MHPIFRVGSWCRNKKRFWIDKFPTMSYRIKLDKVVEGSFTMVSVDCWAFLLYIFYLLFFLLLFSIGAFSYLSLCISFDLRHDHSRLHGCTNLKKGGMGREFYLHSLCVFLIFSLCIPPFSLCAFLLFLFVHFSFSLCVFLLISDLITSDCSAAQTCKPGGFFYNSCCRQLIHQY